jgi:hypothetical protein
MADADPSSREDLLREEFHQQTARIAWHDMQTYYARGSVIRVGEELNLVEVAVQLGMDNTGQFQAWIEAGAIASVRESEAQLWFDSNPTLWAVVAAPWVLVQAIAEG